MDNKINRRAIFYFAIAASAALLLAGGLARIPFYAPTPFLWTPSRRLMLFQNHAIEPAFLSGMLFFLFIAAVISIFLTRKGRRNLLILLLIVALVTFFLYTFAPNGLQSPQANMPRSQPTEPASLPPLTPLPPALPDAPIPQTPGWLITAIGLGVSLLFAVSIVALFWLALRPRSAFAVPGNLAQEAQAAIDALESGADFKDSITRCYAQMSRALQQERGLERSISMTPQEFEKLLIKIGFPAGPVQTLTRLFEEVRYGDIPAADPAIQQAVASLNAIVAHCKAMG